MRRELIIIITLIIIGGLSMSCKKDWTCQCEPKEDSYLSVQHIPIDKQTKKDAEAQCKEHKTEELECGLR